MLDAHALFRSIFMLLIAGLGAFHSSAAVQQVELNISISSIEADNSVTPSGTTWYTKALARLIKTVDQAAQDDGRIATFYQTEQFASCDESSTDDDHHRCQRAAGHLTRSGVFHKSGVQSDNELQFTPLTPRYHQPVVMRFYSNDPIDMPGHMKRGNPTMGFNRYAYANNNPYKYIDPNGESVFQIGRFAFQAGWKIGGAINYGVQAATGASLGVLIYNVAHTEKHADDIVNDVLDGKEKTDKPGEYVGDPADVESDLDALTGGATQKYPNGTRVGQMEDGSTVEQHGSSGKGTDGNKGVNVKPGTPTIKITRPPGIRNITIRYPEVKNEKK